MDDALCLVLEQALPLEPVRVPLDQAAGCVLAEDVVVRLRLTLTLDVAAFDWCGIYHSRGPPIAHVPTHIHTTRRRQSPSRRSPPPSWTATRWWPPTGRVRQLTLVIIHTDRRFEARPHRFPPSTPNTIIHKLTHTTASGTYPVVGRITAGVDPNKQGLSVGSGAVAYITTGSKLPQGADAVRCWGVVVCVYYVCVGWGDVCFWGCREPHVLLPTHV